MSSIAVTCYDAVSGGTRGSAAAKCFAAAAFVLSVRIAGCAWRVKIPHIKKSLKKIGIIISYPYRSIMGVISAFSRGSSRSAKYMDVRHGKPTKTTAMGILCWRRMAMKARHGRNVAKI